MTIRINMNKAKTGWYFFLVYNSNDNLATKTNIRLPKKDIKEIIKMLNSYDNIELEVYTSSYYGDYKYKYNYIDVDEFIKNDSITYIKEEIK